MRFLSLFLLSLPLSIPGLAQPRPGWQDDQFDAMSVAQLESRLTGIDDQLQDLSSYSLRGGTGSIGYRSFWQDDSQWIEIKLDRAYPIDEIVLVPCLWRHSTRGFLADAFPRRIRVFGGIDPDGPGTEIAAYQQTPGTLKGIEPLVLPTSPLLASWIRIEASELTDRYFDKHSVLQLAEIMVFSGSENVALHCPVTASSSDRRGLSGAWHEHFLVDGFTPYLMDSARGSSSMAFVAFADVGSSFTLDLGAPFLLSSLNLHGVEQSDTVPQAYSEALGIPHRFLLEGSLLPDFSPKVSLFDFEKKSNKSTGPIIMVRFPAVSCRYIRLTPTVPPLLLNQPTADNRIGFAEIELFSNGENVALHSAVTSAGLKYGQRTLTALTDGNNLYGQILPIRKWMNELALRGALERERPVVLAELNLRYEQQKNLLARMIQLVFLLLIVIGFVILIDRHLRLRKINQVRERIAADLHDELGADIHTIGLISDLAKRSLHAPGELEQLLDEIRIYTERSGEAARYCTNILEARGVCEDLVEAMMQFANRILADLEHDVSFQNEETLKRLDSHKRIDLLLFYKESLTNIIRHSGATKVFTHVTVENNILSLVVGDDGKGLDLATAGKPPPSLQRRAKLLGAKISTQASPSGGSQINLTLKTRKSRFRP